MSWPGRPPARTGARPRWTPARRAAVLPELRRAIPGQEVAALLTRAETRARDLLTSHRQALAQLATALLDQETITGDQIRAIAGGNRRRWASAITGTRPARDTRLGSSNVA